MSLTPLKQSKHCSLTSRHLLDDENGHQLALGFVLALAMKFGFERSLN